MGTYIATLADKRPLDDRERFWWYHLELVEPPRVDFQAGQYVEVGIGRDQKWKFWMCSSPEMNHAVEFLVDVTRPTDGAKFFRGLKPGDKVECFGPEGSVVAKDQDEKLYLVAEGVGIAPMRSIFVDLLEMKLDTREIKLLWGLDYVEEMFWEEEVYQLAEEHQNFSQTITLSHPPQPEWQLASGTVDQLLEREDFEEKGWVFLVAGFGERVERIREALAAKGVENGQIRSTVIGK